MKPVQNRVSKKIRSWKASRSRILWCCAIPWLRPAFWAEACISFWSPVQNEVRSMMRCWRASGSWILLVGMISSEIWSLVYVKPAIWVKPAFGMKPTLLFKACKWAEQEDKGLEGIPKSHLITSCNFYFKPAFHGMKPDFYSLKPAILLHRGLHSDRPEKSFEISWKSRYLYWTLSTFSLFLLPFFISSPQRHTSGTIDSHGWCWRASEGRILPLVCRLLASTCQLERIERWGAGRRLETGSHLLS